MLSGRGFKEVYNLKGGIEAWEGSIAEGPVELNLDMVRGDETPVEIIRLGYGMEQNLGTFYRIASEKTSDVEINNLLNKLSLIEEKHKQYLLELYNEIEPFPVDKQAFEAEISTMLMEGGFKIDEFLAKNERYLNNTSSLLDLSMMLEAQALDLYLRFVQKMENEQTKSILHKIGNEEKAHLESLGKLREKIT